MAQPSLPVEILETIVDQIGAQSLVRSPEDAVHTLANLSLSSRVLLRRARLYLFRNITVLMDPHCDDVDARSPNPVAALFKANVELFQYVKKLDLCLETCLALTSEDGNLDLTLEPPCKDALFLLDGLLEHGHVESLTIDGIGRSDQDERWTDIHQETRDRVWRFLAASSIRYLEILHLMFPSCALRSLTPTLKSLGCWYATMDEHGTTVFNQDMARMGYSTNGVSKASATTLCIKLQTSSPQFIQHNPSFFDNLTFLKATIQRSSAMNAELNRAEDRAIPYLMPPTIRKLWLEIEYKSDGGLEEDIVLSNFNLPKFPRIPHLQELTLELDLFTNADKRYLATFCPILFPDLVMEYFLAEFSTIQTLNIIFTWFQQGDRALDQGTYWNALDWLNGLFIHPKSQPGFSRLDEALSTLRLRGFPNLRKIGIVVRPKCNHAYQRWARDQWSKRMVEVLQPLFVKTSASVPNFALLAGARFMNKWHGVEDAELIQLYD